MGIYGGSQYRPRRAEIADSSYDYVIITCYVIILLPRFRRLSLFPRSDSAISEEFLFQLLLCTLERATETV